MVLRQLGVLVVSMAIFAVSSCLSSDFATCANGELCPTGLVCSNEFGCVSPFGCGNGTISEDEGEVCDDGNTESGDGCRSDCQKVEECGDLIVDAGEDCDDGNSIPADGCDECRLSGWEVGSILGAARVGQQLARPSGVAVALDGTMYVVETFAHQVVRVDAATSEVSVVAGIGSIGYSGDGGLGAAARLSGPEGVAVDGLGNVFIADTQNNRIRRVDAASRLITTVVGSGIAGFAGDGGPATSAQLNRPLGVAVDGLGNLYVADSQNNRIRRIDAQTGLIETVAGNANEGYVEDDVLATSTSLHKPSGVAFDSDGSFLIADTANHRIRRVDAVTKIITTFAGTGTSGDGGDGGAATDAELKNPRGVHVDSITGEVYVADTANHRLRRIDASGVISTVAGTGDDGDLGDGGPALDAQLSNPYSVARNADGDLLIADTTNHKIRRIDGTETISTVLGTGSPSVPRDGAAATSAKLSAAAGVVVDGAGNVYLSDQRGQVVLRVDGATQAIFRVAGTGRAGFSGDGELAVDARLRGPRGLALAPDGSLYLSDSNNGRVRRVDTSTGVITTVAGGGSPAGNGDGGLATEAKLIFPYGLAIDDAGHLYIADEFEARVRRVDAVSGIITTVAGGGAPAEGIGDGELATDAELLGPDGLAVDSLGNLFIADARHGRVRRVDAVSGIITTVAGGGSPPDGLGDGGAATAAQLSHPQDVSLDGAGNLLIADSDHGRIRLVDAETSEISTIAGSGGPPDTGDGGPAVDATMWEPWAVGVDGGGHVLLADGYGGHLRRVDVDTHLISTVAGAIEPPGTGRLDVARLTDPRALLITPLWTFIPAGRTGVMEAIGGGVLSAVVGRYPQEQPTADLARFRDGFFGDIIGVAHDATRTPELLYLTEVHDLPAAPGQSKHRIHVVSQHDPSDPSTWTIAVLAGDSVGFTDGDATDAEFRRPAGLYLDTDDNALFVADAGNHVIRKIELSTDGTAATLVSTVVGTPLHVGFAGDGQPANEALLYQPEALTRCPSGDLYVGDTASNRIRRIEAVTNTISTVLGTGLPSSAGVGIPAEQYSVNHPLGLACDSAGNLFVSSTTAIRLLAADLSGVVDGSGAVTTVIENPNRCFTGIAVIDGNTIWATDACAGSLEELSKRE